MKHSDLEAYKNLLHQRVLQPLALWSNVIDEVSRGFGAHDGDALDALGLALARLTVYDIPPSAKADHPGMQRVRRKLMDDIVQHVYEGRRQELLDRSLAALLMDTVVRDRMLLAPEMLAEAAKRLMDRGARPFGSFASGDFSVILKGGEGRSSCRITPVGILSTWLKDDQKVLDQLAAVLPVLVPQRLADSPFVAEKGVINSPAYLSPCVGELDGVDDYISAAMTTRSRQACLLLDRVDITLPHQRNAIVASLTHLLCGVEGQSVDNSNLYFRTALEFATTGPLGDEDRRRVWRQCLGAEVMVADEDGAFHPAPFWHAALTCLVMSKGVHDADHDGAQLMQQLLKSGLSANACRNAITPLIAATRIGCVETVKVLLAAGAQPRSKGVGGVPDLESHIQELLASPSYRPWHEPIAKIGMMIKAHQAQRVVNDVMNGRHTTVRDLD